MRRKLLSLLAAALLLSPLPALAQIGQTATLTGTVTDASGAVLPGVTVTVTERIAHRRVAVRDYGRERRLSLPGAAAGRLHSHGGAVRLRRRRRRKRGSSSVRRSRSTPKLEVGGLTDTVTVRGDAPRRRREIVGGAEEPHDRRDGEHPVHAAGSVPARCCSSPGVNPNNYSSYGSGGSRRTPT